MLRYDYHESIIFWVVSTSHAIQRVVNEELVPLGMTFRQAEVLAWLAMEGPPCPRPSLRGECRSRPRRWVALSTAWNVTGGSSVITARRIVGRPCYSLPSACSRSGRTCSRWDSVRARATEGLSPEQVEHVLKALALVQENLRNPSNDPGDET